MKRLEKAGTSFCHGSNDCHHKGEHLLVKKHFLSVKLSQEAATEGSSYCNVSLQ